MNLIMNTNQFNIANIYYNEPIQNIVMDNSKFIKMIYSTEDVSILGIYLSLQIKIISNEKYFKKIKFTYDMNTNKDILYKLYEIENNILNKYNYPKKQRKIIYETFNNGSIKLFPKNESDTGIENTNQKRNISSFILKISGIWENDTEYGLTYKLLCA